MNDLYLWNALWMAWSTTATIGYGEITPTTHLGRVVCCFVSFVGVAFAACLTAAFANILAWTPDELAALFYFEREKARRALRHDAACLVTSTIRQSIARTRRRRAEGQPPSLENELELHRHAMRTRRFRRNKIISEVRFCPRARAPARSCAAEQGRFGGAAQADQVTSEEVRAEELLERAAHMRDATEALQRLTLPSTTWLASLPEPPPLSPLSPASPLRNGPCLPRAARRRRRRRPPPLPAARLKRGRACRSSGAGHTARDAGGGVPGPGLVARWPRRGGGRRRAQVARA